MLATAHIADQTRERQLPDGLRRNADSRLSAHLGTIDFDKAHDRWPCFYRSILAAIMIDKIKLTVLCQAAVIRGGVNSCAKHHCLMVRAVGIEPTLVVELDFELLLNPARLPIHPRTLRFVVEVVPPVRLERTLLSELDFESSASTIPPRGHGTTAPYRKAGSPGKSLNLPGHTVSDRRKMPLGKRHSDWGRCCPCA